MRKKRINIVVKAKELLTSPYCIAPSPDAETAIPIIKGLLNEVKYLRQRLTNN